MSKVLGQVRIEDCFIRGSERIKGTNKQGNEYDFLTVRFEDSTGEGLELRAEDEAKAEDFPKRKEGTLIANIYWGKGKQGLYYFLKVVGFEEDKKK